MSIRLMLIAAALLALPAASAEAQQRRAPAKPAPAAAPEPPPVFPCRTEAEICYLGIVVGPNVAILYSNAPEAAVVEGRPVEVTGADGTKLDLSKDNGRVVMLTGTFDPKAGIGKAEIVEVAGPLQSLVIKAQLVGGGEEAAAPPKGGARRR